MSSVFTFYVFTIYLLLTLWEDTNSTEHLMNSESNPISGPNDIINDTSKKFLPSECDDTGRIERRKRRHRDYMRNYYIKTPKYREDSKKRASEHHIQNRKSKNMAARNRRLQIEYGITHEQVKRMYISQSGNCAICGNKFNGRWDICVDHNHTTEQVRQILCRKCNSGLGHFRENPSILLRAIDYINKWNSNTKDEPNSVI